MFTTRSPFRDVPARQWARWRDANDAIVIDLREPFGWADGTLLGPKPISMAALAPAVSSYDRERTLLRVCASGNRSSAAAAGLAAGGFSDVASWAGGVPAASIR